MQTLWSRVAQTRSCRCVSCIHHSAKALSRRTATSAAKRRMTAGDVFTACFSSTLATAAILDMQVKQTRRAQWDQAIREAKEEGAALEEPEVQETVLQMQPIEGQAIQETAIQMPVLKEVAVEEPATQGVMPKRGSSSRKGLSFRKVQYKRKRIRIEKDLLFPSKVHGMSWRQPLPANQASMEEQLRLLNHYINNVVSKTESIWRPGQPLVYKNTVTSLTTGETTAYFSKLSERKPKSHIHLQRIQDMIFRLVARLLLATKSVDPIGGQDETLLKFNSRAEIVAKIGLLSSSDAQLPSYGPVDTKRTESQVVELNRSISSILQDTETGSDVMVAKICYNLLVTPVPPDTTTYTLLLLGFLKLGLGDLAQIIVDGFLDDCIFKPNEMTIAAILNHYISQNDYPGFYKVIQRMRGVNGDMRIKKRHIYYLYHRRVANWAANVKVIHRNGYLVEKVIRDQMIFHTLVVGTCMFNHMTRAIMFTRAMIREGYCLTLGLLNTLVRACISKNDLKNARALLSVVLKTWSSDEARNDMTRRVDISSHARYFIHMLMSYCGVNLSGSWTIEEISQSLLISFDSVTLQHFTRAMQLESLAEEVNRMEDTIFGIITRLTPYVPMAAHVQKKKRGDPSRTLYKCLKKAEIYLSRRIDSEVSKQTQKRLREKEAAVLYLQGGKTERRLEKARQREREQAFMVSSAVHHCEDDHPLARSPKMTAREVTTTEGTIEQSEADAVDEIPTQSTELSTTDSRPESENAIPKLSPMATESPQLALTTLPEPDLRAAAAA